MKGLVLELRARRRTLLFEILLLSALVCVAGYVWTAPQRAESALKHATLAELQAETRGNPNHARAFYYLGRRLQQAGQLSAAHDAFAQAAQLDVDDEQSWLATAALSSQLYGDQGAFDLLGIYLKRHPESAQAHLALAQLYSKNMSYRRAQQEALSTTKFDPHLAEAWYLAGRSANSLGSATDAEALLRKAVAEAPKEWRYAMTLGDVLATEKRDQEALGFALQAARQAPEEGVTYLSLGKLQFEMAKSAADLETARQTLARSAELQPEIPLTYLLLGRVTMRQARWQEAKAAMENAARLAPIDPDPIFELVRIARRLGDTSGAARYTALHLRLREYAQQKQTLKEKIVTLKNQAPELRLKLARLSEAIGDSTEALAQYRHYLEINPADDEVKQKLVALQSRTTGAAQTAHLVLASNPSGPANGAMSALLQQAVALYARKQYASAEQAYVRILDQDKQSALGCQGLGLTLDAEGRSDQALEYLLRAVALDPNLAPAQYALSRAYMAINAPAEARRRLMKVVSIDAGNAAYWHLLGMACSGADPYHDQAEDALRRAVTLEPKNVAYWLDLADLVAEGSKPEDAEAIYRQALALAPENTDTLARFGMFLAKARPTPERQAEAETLLRKVLAHSPDDSYTLYALGQLSLDRGDGRQAVSYLQRSIAHSTQVDIAELWYLLARAYRRAGDPTSANRAQAVSSRLREEYQAMKHAEEQLSKSPQDADLRLKLARTYARRGENAKSIDMYRACLQISPNNTPAHKELSGLENRLKASGQLPLTTAFRALIAAAGQTSP